MIRVGVVGLGYTIGIAQMHIKGYSRLDNVQITALYDIVPGRAEDYISKLGLQDAKVCTSYEELLSLVDAVSICTPNSTHVSLSVQAMQAGKHVLCEKPFAPSAPDCADAIRYAELSQRVCMIGLCYRGIPGFMYMKQLINEGFLGDIFFVRESQGGARIASPKVKLEWRMQQSLSGPGAVADFGSHMLDMTDYMLRPDCGKIAEVQCMQGIYIANRERIGDGVPAAVTNDDVAVFQARTERGTLISFTASRLGCDHTMEIYGSGGYIGFNGNNPLELTIQRKDKDGGYTGPREVVQVPREMYEFDGKPFGSNFEINFAIQCRDFIASIEGNTPAKTDFSRGEYIQRLIDALQLSADTGEIVKTDF